MTTISPLSTVWRTVLADSYRALSQTVAVVRPDQWTLPTPCARWNVTQVIQHAAGDQLAYAAALGLGAGPAYDPFDPSGSIEGTSPADLVRDALELTATAWATVADTTATVPTPLPHGDLPTAVAAVLSALDAAVHAWDIAVATGKPSPLTEDLSTHLLTAARTVAAAPGGGETEIVEPLRRWGAYAEILDPESGDGPTEHLLRYLGRDPRVA